LGAFDEVEELGLWDIWDNDGEYAIKVIHVEALTPYLWQREVLALQAVEHPNVVAFRGSGHFTAHSRDYPYLECEYIAGGSARTNLDGGSRPATGDKLLELLSGLLAGVAEIHDLGMAESSVEGTTTSELTIAWTCRRRSSPYPWRSFGELIECYIMLASDVGS
jgi:serine/threonine protein kinase